MCKIGFFALCLPPGARLPVLGSFHTGMVPSVPKLKKIFSYEQ